MAERVPWVPNRWRPYMDGSIWKFTHSEFSALPRFTPAFDPTTGAPTGLNQIVWTIDDAVYVVFFDRENDPNSNDPKRYEQPNPNDIALPDSLMYYGDGGTE